MSRKNLPTLLFFLFLTQMALATSIIPPKNMGELIDMSSEVVFVKCIDIDTEVSEEGKIYTRYNFSVLTPIKGNLQSFQNFSVRSLSYQTKDGLIFAVPDEGTYHLGHNYVLPLSDVGARLKETVMSYGVLEEKKINGKTYLVRTKESLHYKMYNPDGETIENYGPYNTDEFLIYAKNYTKGKSFWNEQSIYAKGIVYSPLNREAAPDHCVNVFDNYQYDVRWTVNNLDLHHTNSLSGKSNLSSLLASALSGISQEYGIDITDNGTGTINVSCGNNGPQYSPSIYNTISMTFADPCNEMADLSNCKGTLGYGGPIGGTPLHTWKGQNYYTAYQGFVVINDGAECVYDVGYITLLSHEISHTLGLGHIEDTDGVAQMNPFCCNQITNLDRQCGTFLYSTTLPVVFVDFSLESEYGQNELLWTVAEEQGVDYYEVEISENGSDFKSIERVYAQNNGAESLDYFVYHRPDAGSTTYYRITAHDYNGDEMHSDILKSESPVDEHVANYRDGILTVYSSILSDGGRLTLTSVNGKVIFSSEINSESALLKIPLADLSTGFYVLTTSGNGQTYNQKLFID